MKNVLVCVTGQRSCERLIRYGKELIEGDGGNMMVAHIAGYDLTELKEGDLAENLEFLHHCALEHEANLTIIRSDNVVGTMVSLINRFDISRLVLGETRKPNESESTKKAFMDLSHTDVQIIVVPEEEPEEEVPQDAV